MYFHRALELMLLKSGRMLVELLPYLVVGVLASQALRYTALNRLLQRACSTAPFKATLLAAVFGIVSPLCTYGTVPVVVQLYREGVPLGPLVTFLSTSALMNPQLFLLTWGGIGPEMAVVRTLAVLGFGLLLGAVVHRLPLRWLVNPRVHAVDDADDGGEARLDARRFEWRSFARQSWDSLLFVTYYLVIGILIGAAIEVWVPMRFIVTVFRPGQWGSVVLAAILGVPLYACGGGTIPLVRSLINQGMSEGAALAFFIAGPATRPTPLLALAAILRPRFIVGYVVGLLAFSIAAGMLYAP